MDKSDGMLWLNSTFPENASASAPGAGRGPWSAASRDVAFSTKEFPSAKITFLNIRVGDIGSTSGSGNGNAFA
jgi:cellulose 1,4-beta-cellobiosidase